MRARRVARSLAWALACATAVAIAPDAGTQSKSSAPVQRVLPPSNSAILLDAMRGAANRLIAQAPLTPGTRVALRPPGDAALDQDVRDAVVEALTRRRIQCVLLAPSDSALLPGLAPGTLPASPATPTASPAPTGAGASSLSDLSSSFEALQAERQAQAARAESLARIASGAGADGSPSVNGGAAAIPGGAATPQGTALASGTDGALPVLTLRVLEARVDYVRQFRGGIFGAQRIERRALASLSGRLSPPASEAVSWTASADSTVGDVVLKSDLASLEDRQRAETRGTVPSAGFKKVLEPLLVVVLIVGLVSLFYQNRP